MHFRRAVYVRERRVSAQKEKQRRQNEVFSRALRLADSSDGSAGIDAKVIHGGISERLPGTCVGLAAARARIRRSERKEGGSAKTSAQALPSHSGKKAYQQVRKLKPAMLRLTAARCTSGGVGIEGKNLQQHQH